MVQDGDLNGIPVKEGSLVVQGLKNITWHKHKHRTQQRIVHGLFFVSLFFVVVDFLAYIFFGNSLSWLQW